MSNRLDWTPGNWGKGLVEPSDGSVTTWVTDSQYGGPHHGEVALGDVNETAEAHREFAAFNIAPDGRVEFSYLWPADEHTRRLVLRSDPRLRPDDGEGEDWRFEGATDSPRGTIEPPRIVESRLPALPHDPSLDKRFDFTWRRSTLYDPGTNAVYVSQPGRHHHEIGEEFGKPLPGVTRIRGWIADPGYDYGEHSPPTQITGNPMGWWWNAQDHGKYPDAAGQALMEKYWPEWEKPNFNFSKTAGATRAQRLRLRSEAEDEVGQVDMSTPMHSWPDGWTINKLNTYGDLQHEGLSMGNCLAQGLLDAHHSVWNYHPQAEHWDSGNNEDPYIEIPEEPDYSERIPKPYTFYSLRDPDNLPHASYDQSAEFGSLVLGMHNADPKPEYLKRMHEVFGDQVLPTKMYNPPISKTADAAFATELKLWLQQVDKQLRTRTGPTPHHTDPGQMLPQDRLGAKHKKHKIKTPRELEPAKTQYEQAKRDWYNRDDGWGAATPWPFEPERWRKEHHAPIVEMAKASNESVPQVKWVGEPKMQGDHSFHYSPNENTVYIGSPEYHHHDIAQHFNITSPDGMIGWNEWDPASNPDGVLSGAVYDDHINMDTTTPAPIQDSIRMALGLPAPSEEWKF